MTSSTTLGWPVSSSSLQAASKASPIAAIASGSNSPGFTKEWIDIAAISPPQQSPPRPAHKPAPAAIVGDEAFKRDGPVGGGRRVPSRSHRGDTPPSGQYPKGGLDVRGYCNESHRAVLSLRDGASNTIAARTESPSRKDTLSSPNAARAWRLASMYMPPRNRPGALHPAPQALKGAGALSPYRSSRYTPNVSRRSRTLASFNGPSR